MSQASLDHSDTTEAGILMFASKVAEGQVNCVEKLVELIGQKSEQDRFLIFTDNKLARNTMVSLLGKGIQSCIFVSDMCDDEEVISEEKIKLNKLKVAVCSYEAYKKIGLLLVENYAFVGFPAKKTQLPKMLDAIDRSAEKNSRMVRIDFVVSSGEPPEMMRVLQMEMKNRKDSCPFWLAEAVILNFASPDRQALLIEEERKKRNQSTKAINHQEQAASASDTSGSPMSSFSIISERSPVPVKKPVERARVSRSENNFNIYEMKPNAEGKYVVPMNMIRFGEQDEEDDYSEEDNSYGGDYEYDYDEHDFEAEYDFEN